MSAALTLAALAVMAVAAARAERRFRAHPTLPMQFGLDGRPAWRAPRRMALAFLPALSLAAALALAALAPGTHAPLVAVLSLLAGQALYHALLERAA